MNTAEIIFYESEKHHDLPVSPDAYQAFASLLPTEAKCGLDNYLPIKTVGEVVECVRDYMRGYLHTCQTRPALPHEREDYGDVRFLTKKGAAKWKTHLCSIATAFQEAFGLAPIRSVARGPAEGPLDPLIYD